ncbi:MAG: hypothetical protein MUC45_10035 [Actinomycetia bacterium]|jgi:hypothetical protein|nr:hypothetical protein [Actinomycetes bacterium]
MAGDAHDNHGQTPAAWTAVIIVMLGFLVGAIGVIAATPWLFAAGAVLIVLGAVVGKVMQMMGLGAKPTPGSPAS